jgi:hypothetical protein
MLSVILLSVVTMNVVAPCMWFDIANTFNAVFGIQIQIQVLYLYVLKVIVLNTLINKGIYLYKATRVRGRGGVGGFQNNKTKH